jgi:hypothetical protein
MPIKYPRNLMGLPENRPKKHPATSAQFGLKKYNSAAIKSNASSNHTNHAGPAGQMPRESH